MSSCVCMCVSRPIMRVFLLYSSGIETFKGQYLHSRDYKTPDEWRNKKVVVVGIGNSGGDIAVELSRVTKQVGPFAKKYCKPSKQILDLKPELTWLFSLPTCNSGSYISALGGGRGSWTVLRSTASLVTCKTAGAWWWCASSSPLTWRAVCSRGALTSDSTTVCTTWNRHTGSARPGMCVWWD